MHPNTFLRTFWRSDFTPEVFVAMSFAEHFERRFRDIIEPAIEAVQYEGVSLRANRVDLSRTGDSILTDIADGISRALLVLADVSTLGHDSKTGESYRNANVMYEVGLALACRQSSEVLLIRDDKDRFLFDVSVVPHKHIDFSEPAVARQAITNELSSRINETKHVNDSRVAIAVSSLTTNERSLLQQFSQFDNDDTFWFKQGNLAVDGAVARLLDKRLIRTHGVRTVEEREVATFAWTRIGYAVGKELAALLPPVTGQTKREAQAEALASNSVVATGSVEPQLE